MKEARNDLLATTLVIGEDSLPCTRARVRFHVVGFVGFGNDEVPRAWHELFWGISRSNWVCQFSSKLESGKVSYGSGFTLK